MIIHNYYLNPLTDFGFKRIFGSEENKPLLLDFLNTFLESTLGHITEVTFLSPEVLGEEPDEKKSIFDLYCVTQDGDHVIIEMQRARQSFFSSRAVAYSARVISKSVRRGNRRYQLARVVSFNILDYDSPDFRNSDDYFHTVWLKDDLNEIFSDKMCLCFLELSKFAAQTRPDVAVDKRRLWAYFLKHLPEMQPDEEGFTKGVFKSLMETCRMEKLNDMEKKDYEKSVLEYEDVQDAIAYARKTALAEGKTAGLAEGLAEGKAKGLAEGEAKGLAKGEANATRTIAAKMLASGMDAAAISSLTGLTEEEILKLQH